MAGALSYALLATAFVIFVTFSPIKKHRDGAVLLNRRLGCKFPVPNFDPLVQKMQRLAEERGLNSSKGNPLRNQAQDNANDEYFSEKEELNITLRFLVLFPLLDKAPKDALISFEELQAWNNEQTIDHLAYRTRKEMEIRDKDGDGEISFFEFLPQFSDKDIEKNEMGHGEAGWWMDQFRNADVDRNGTLNFNEFNNFLHPEDSNNAEIQKWLLRDKIKRMDDDHDGKLSFAEFSKYVYDTYKSYAEFEQSAAAETVEKKFSELDINKDKFLVVEELIPMLRFLRPGELSYAKYYTRHVMKEADDNGDGYLTLDEMLNHQHTFYNTIYAGYDDDNNHEDFDDSYRDEL